jgi:hypothetical protein
MAKASESSSSPPKAQHSPTDRSPACPQDVGEQGKALTVGSSTAGRRVHPKTVEGPGRLSALGVSNRRAVGPWRAGVDLATAIARPA